MGQSIALDNLGGVYITGSTTSTNFVTHRTGGGAAFQSALNGASDAFVIKLDNSLSTVDYSTYLGGNSTSSQWLESGDGIVVDSDYHAYVTGETRGGTNFPTTAGAYQEHYDPMLPGSGDGFV